MTAKTVQELIIRIAAESVRGVRDGERASSMHPIEPTECIEALIFQGFFALERGDLDTANEAAGLEVPPYLEPAKLLLLALTHKAKGDSNAARPLLEMAQEALPKDSSGQRPQLVLYSWGRVRILEELEKAGEPRARRDLVSILPTVEKLRGSRESYSDLISLIFRWKMLG